MMTYLMPPSPWILSSQSNAFVDFGECILTDAVANELRSEFGLRVQVTPVPHGTLPRFEIKAKRLTDHRQVISESESA